MLRPFPSTYFSINHSHSSYRLKKQKLCRSKTIVKQTKYQYILLRLLVLFVVYLTTLFQYLRLYSVDFYSILIRLPSSSDAGETRVRNMAAEFCRRAPIVIVRLLVSFYTHLIFILACCSQITANGLRTQCRLFTTCKQSKFKLIGRVLWIH
jgi:hypothetical protein